MDQYPKRKQIRLSDHDYSKPGAYFITICTYKKARLFGQIKRGQDGHIYLQGFSHRSDKMIDKWIFEVENAFPTIRIDTHIIMPDHIHLILQISDLANTIQIPTVIDWFKTMTTNEYIRLVKEGMYPPFHKAVWQRGYYEHVIRNIDDLTEIRDYVIRNPQICYFRHLPKHIQGGFHES